MVFGLFVSNKVDDAGKATDIARNYLEKQHGNIGLLLFRVEEVKPNTNENIWIVVCSLFTSLGSTERAYYEIKLNVKDGKIEKVNKIEKPKWTNAN